MDTFGSRLSKLRKEQKMTQDDLAFKLNVSRQTISSWERDRSEPDIATLNKIAEIFHSDMDGLLRGIDKCLYDNRKVKWLFLFTSLIQIIFAIYLLVKHQENGIGGVILFAVLWIINATMYFMIGFINKHKEYSLLAGYSEDSEYNINELAKMLERLRFHSCSSSLIWSVLLILIYLANRQTLWPILTIIYTFDFVISLLVETYRSQSRILVQKQEKIIAKQSFLSGGLYLLLLFIWTIAFFVIFEINDIQNNTKEAVILVMYLIVFIIINSIYLVYAQYQAKKETYNQRKDIIRALLIAFFNIIAIIFCGLIGYIL